MRLQLRRTIVSTSRQAWINTLRDSIAELQTKSIIIVEESDIEAIKSLYLLLNKTQLLLNPTEDDHVELIALLKLLYHSTAKTSSIFDKEFEALQESITKKSQAVLKKEWTRVKKGK
jgi:hypothetical protein